jgi:hypothetical protein
VDVDRGGPVMAADVLVLITVQQKTNCTASSSQLPLYQIKLSNLELLCLPNENLHLFNRS